MRNHDSAAGVFLIGNRCIKFAVFENKYFIYFSYVCPMKLFWNLSRNPVEMPYRPSLIVVFSVFALPILVINGFVDVACIIWVVDGIGFLVHEPVPPAIAAS